MEEEFINCNNCQTKVKEEEAIYCVTCEHPFCGDCITLVEHQGFEEAFCFSCKSNT